MGYHVKHLRTRIKRYTASLLVVAMLFTQYGSSYAQAATETGVHQTNFATGSDAEVKDTEQPVISEEETDYEYEDEYVDDEIPLEDDRYDEATISNAHTASRSNAIRAAADTFELRYKVMVNEKWEIIHEEEVLRGDDGVPPEVPERDGYTFAGWSRGNPYVNVQKSTTVTATYVSGKVPTSEVRFINESGRLVENPQYIQEGMSAAYPSEKLYLKEGYTFLGWEQEFYNIQSELEVTPRYAEGDLKVYQISYLAYHNNVKMTIKREWVPAGEDGTPPEVPEREGYTFAGWGRLYSYVNVQSGCSLSAGYVSGDVRLHIVEFVSHQGRLVENPQYIQEGKGAAQPSKDLYKRTGYTFLGWEQEFYNITGDIEIRPRYAEGEKEAYYLLYKAIYNGDFITIKCEWVVKGGDGIPPEVPKREGYTFAGWTRTYSYVNVERNRSIYAGYVNGEAKMHIVEFLGVNGRPVVNSAYVQEGMSAVPPSESLYERVGYTFLGWDQEFYGITEDRKIWPRYAVGEQPSYLLRYEAYYKRKAIEIKREWVPAGGNGTAPQPPSREGYTFAGWSTSVPYLNVNASGKVTATYVKGEVSMHKVSFYGKVTGNDQYVLLKEAYVQDGGTASPPTLPGVVGYRFREWTGDYTNIKSGTIIYALYDAQFYTVRFWNGTTRVSYQLVKEGQSATTPAAPEAPEGYYFSGWDKAFGNVQGDLDIYAMFEPQQTELITEAEFIRQIRALGFPKELEESFIELGIEARKLLESQNSRGRVAGEVIGISLVALLPSIAKAALYAVIAYGITYAAVKIWESGVIQIFSAYVGELGRSAIRAVLDQIAILISEGGSNAIAIGLGDIAGKYGFKDMDDDGYGKCETAAREMVDYLKENNEHGELITLMWSPRDSGIIWSDYAQKSAGYNGLHVGVLYEGVVFCNVHPYGLPEQQWIDDFTCLPPAVKLPPVRLKF